jgi:hypothetical protein
MKRRMQMQSRPLTLAEVCEAITNGRVPSEIEDGYYKVTRRALRQLERPADTRVTLSKERPVDLAG